MAKSEAVGERAVVKQAPRSRRGRRKARVHGNHDLSPNQVRRFFSKRKRELLKQVRLCDRAMAATAVLN